MRERVQKCRKHPPVLLHVAKYAEALRIQVLVWIEAKATLKCLRDRHKHVQRRHQRHYRVQERGPIVPQ